MVNFELKLRLIVREIYYRIMKNKMVFYAIIMAASVITLPLTSQPLKPGFDADELMLALLINARIATDSSYFEDFEKPEGYTLTYRSPEIGLANLWELWTSSGRRGVISIRGTTSAPQSWLSNVYAGMVAARGQLIIAEADTFRYRLSEHPQAAVHAGWLTSTAFLIRDMMPRIDSLFRSGTRDLIITGHSQGGAISYLITACLRQKQENGELPSDIRFKTYSTAAPKPGNLFFAYEYETMTAGGWGFNAVNAKDWVPEIPFSIQGLKDVNRVNPFTGLEDSLASQQKFPRNLIMRRVFRKLTRPQEKAGENYLSVLGERIGDEVAKALPGFQEPDYYPTFHYVRTGQTVVLHPDEEYAERFPEEPGDGWAHHGHANYIFLAGSLLEE